MAIQNVDDMFGDDDDIEDETEESQGVDDSMFDDDDDEPTPAPVKPKKNSAPAPVKAPKKPKYEEPEPIMEDEDDDEPEVAAPAPKKKTKVVEPIEDDDDDEPVVAAPKKTVEDGFFAGVNLPQGMKSAKSGVVDSRFPITKYKATKGVKDRFGIITDDNLIARIHYLEGFGYFYCWGGECCSVMGISNIYYVYPIIKYDTNAKGKVGSTDYEIMFLALPEAKYKENIIPLIEEGMNASDLDFVVTCSDSKMQKFSMTHFPALWKTKEQFNKKAILAEAKKLAAHIPTCMARVISPEEFHKLNASGIEEDEDDLDGLMD